MKPNVEAYVFICQEWFDKNQGDRKTIRELYPYYGNENQNGKANKNNILFR